MATQSIESLALRPREAAAALGISERTLWTWVQAGKVPCVRVGDGPRKRTLFPVDGLRRWLADKSQGGQN